MFPKLTTIDTAPTVEPITLTEAKEQLRVDHSDHDTMITGLIQAAREQVEAMCGRAIIQQTRIAYFDVWPNKVFHLLYPEIRSITHIKYTSAAGVETTFDSDNYSLDPGSEPGRVVLGYQKVWPSVTLNEENYPIQIEYVCGYETTQTALANNITGITKANPGVVSSASHGLKIGDLAYFDTLTEMTELNGTYQVVSAVGSANAFSINDTSGYKAAETTGGACGYKYEINVPQRIKLAIRLLIESMYGGMQEGYAKYRDDAVYNLLNQYRVWRR
jgi:uncharacterized phiE125 gp8 family phage protein